MKLNLLLPIVLLSSICFSQSNNLSEEVTISLHKKKDAEIFISQEQKSFDHTRSEVNGVVISVTLIENEYHVKYFDTDGKIQTKKYPISPAFVLKTNKTGNFSFSVLTVPFKIRPALGNTDQYVRADIKNLGLYCGPYSKTTNYFFDGTSSIHKWSFGALIAPSVEEFNSKNTEGKVTDASNRLVLSTSAAVTYTYNAITVAIIPVGFDFALSKDNQDWIYNSKYWWGFGLGIDSKLLGF